MCTCPRAVLLWAVYSISCMLFRFCLCPCFWQLLQATRCFQPCSDMPYMFAHPAFQMQSYLPFKGRAL